MPFEGRAACLRHAASATHALTLERSHLRAGRVALTLLHGAVLLLSACRRTDARERDTARIARAASISPTTGRYEVVAIPNPGKVVGTIRLRDDAPSDSVIHPTSDTDVCGSALRDASLDRGDRTLGGVVVWLEGIAAGKPMPLVRRYDVTHHRCMLVPRVQAAVTGGTLNVRSLDRTTHRTRITRAGDLDPLTIVTQTEDGQVVPVERVMSSAGPIELTCGNHPWTRAFVAVFDHPYFDVTVRSGAFELDSIPPGTYRLKVWHERFPTIARQIEVRPNGVEVIEIDLRR